jgi:hypothetical protein
MHQVLPLVLAATVSRSEALELEQVLKEAGLEVRGFVDAECAATELVAHRGACVLVLDAGLLQMSQDAQWRTLRERHPHLGTVIRCLIREPGVRRLDDNTVLVHPDSAETLIEAVLSFTSPSEASGLPAPASFAVHH